MAERRILTNRKFSLKGSFEALTIDDRGIVRWVGDDEGMGASFSFPVDLDFVKEKFAECGRDFDRSKMPANFVENPYDCWI